MSIMSTAYKKLLGYKLYNCISKDNPIYYHLTAAEICETLQISANDVVDYQKLTKPFTTITATSEQFKSGSVFVLYSKDEKILSEYADAAFRLGAKAFIACKQIKSYPCFVVDDPTQAIIKLYRYIRAKHPNVKSIGITGSIGKTTVTSMVKSIFSTHYSIIANSKNRNALSYVGRTIQCVKPQHDRIVQECHEGDRNACNNISLSLQPDISIVTNIAFSHLENFPDKQSFINEFKSVTAGMPENGIVVYNYDDENLKSITWNRKSVSVSIDNTNADYYAKNIKAHPSHVVFTAVTPNGSQEIRINSPGKHNVINALLSFAAADNDNIPVEKIIKGIANFKPDGIRQNFISIRKVNVLLDCYNAAPKSVKAAIDTLKDLKSEPGHNKIAVLGTMAELGDNSDNLHIEVGHYAMNSDIDILITYGKNCDLLGDTTYITNTKVYKAKTKKELDSLLKKHIKKGDTVLFKASNCVHMERRVMHRFKFSVKLLRAFCQYYF